MEHVFTESMFLVGFVIFIAAILVLDMLVIDRKAHVVSIKEAGSWTAVWIILALAFASIISNNVNAIMKRMTSLSITLMIPTLIASFYGMNVDIHLESFPHAFIFIILLSAILSAVTFVWFRRIKWF